MVVPLPQTPIIVEAENRWFTAEAEVALFQSLGLHQGKSIGIAFMNIALQMLRIKHPLRLTTPMHKLPFATQSRIILEVSAPAIGTT